MKKKNLLKKKFFKFFSVAEWSREFAADNKMTNVRFLGRLPNDQVRRLMATRSDPVRGRNIADDQNVLHFRTRSFAAA